MKCINCGTDLTNVKKKKEKVEIVVLYPEDEDFIKESNAIEREYSQEAFEDACDAYRFAYKNREKIDIRYILEIHKILMRRLNPRIAGKIRKCDVWVGREKGENPKEIKELLNILLNPYGVWAPKGEEGIKKCHVQFEKIHPFEDGNGRVGRILMNIQRIKLGLPILIIHTGKEQQEYYKWFK